MTLDMGKAFFLFGEADKHSSWNRSLPGVLLLEQQPKLFGSNNLNLNQNNLLFFSDTGVYIIQSNRRFRQR